MLQADLGVVLHARRCGRITATAPVLFVLAGALTAAQPAPPASRPGDPLAPVVSDVATASGSYDDAAEARELAAERADRHRREAASTPSQRTEPAAPPKRSRESTGSAARRPPAPGPNPAPATGNLAAVVNFALSQVGKPYVYGAAGPAAYDCSGLIAASFARIGITLPHQSEAIAARGRQIPRDRWQPGTVLHWPGHVALYLGGGRMVHASHPGVPVRVADVYGAPTGYLIGA